MCLHFNSQNKWESIPGPLSRSRLKYKEKPLIQVIRCGIHTELWRKLNERSSFIFKYLLARNVVNSLHASWALLAAYYAPVALLPMWWDAGRKGSPLGDWRSGGHVRIPGIWEKEQMNRGRIWLLPWFGRPSRAVDDGLGLSTCRQVTELYCFSNDCSL